MFLGSIYGKTNGQGRSNSRTSALSIPWNRSNAWSSVVGECIDLVIRIAYPADSSFVVQPITPLPRYLCASPDYLLRRGTPRSPKDLLEHDCLHCNVISEREEWTFRGDDGDESFMINGIFCSNNGDVLATAPPCRAWGITLLPDFIVEDAIADGRLVRILEDRERSTLTRSVLYPSRLMFWLTDMDVIQQTDPFTLQVG